MTVGTVDPLQPVQVQGGTLTINGVTHRRINPEARVKAAIADAFAATAKAVSR